MKKFALGLVVALLALALLEGALRLFDYRGDPAVGDYRLRVAGELYGEPDPVRFWRLPDVEPHFTGDAPRIVCLADSVTVMEQGKGWPDRLPVALNEAGYATPVQVFNAGVPEYTSFQGLQYLRHELLATKPALVTIQFGWNDHWPARTGVPDNRVRMPSAPTLARQKQFSRLRTYRLFRNILISQENSDETLRVPIELYRDNLRQMIALVRQQQGKVLLLTAPYLEGPWGWVELHKQYMEATRAVAQETSVALVDAQELFAKRPDLFFEPGTDQCHFNGMGAELLAAEVAKTVVAHGLLP